MRRILAAFVLVIAAAEAALADSAPVQTLGPNVEPIDATTVRMAEERIEVRLRRDERHPTLYSWDAIAEFRIWFRFEPEADEDLMVGFPLFIWNKAEMIMGNPVEDLRIEVDGEAVAYEIRAGDDDPYHPDHDPTDWAVFPVAFRAGKPLEMTVSYWFPVGAYDQGWVHPLKVSYVLHTGAHWAGTIGRAEAVVTIDKPIAEEHVLAPQQDMQATTPGWVLEDGALRWVWEDLEPDFDLHVTLENPYWLDTAADIRAMIDAGLFDRNVLLRALWGAIHLFEGSFVGETRPLRDGIPRTEAGEQLLPDLMAAAEAHLSGQPDDGEVRDRYLRLLMESVAVSRRDPDGWVEILRSEERLAHTLLLAVRLHDERGLANMVSWWRPWTSRALADHPWQAETQDALAAFLGGAMPTSFRSADAAREWVNLHAGAALRPEQRDGLIEMALARSPGAPGPGAQEGMEQEATRAAAPEGSIGEWTLLACAVTALIGVRRRGALRAGR